MLTPEQQKKVEQAISLLQSVQKDWGGGEIELAYSGGKDSDVILQLAKEAGINYRAIYKNTTVDIPGTIKHALENGAEIRRPKISFFKLLEKSGTPTRLYRHCCYHLKEYKILDKCIMGVRKAESTARNKRYNEVTECRFYGSKKNHVEAIYPILFWNDEDVKAFILDRNIKVHPHYYDENGNLDVTRRVGCMCCPLQSRRKRILGFKKYPRVLRQYIKREQVYLDTHPNAKSHRYFANAYEVMTYEIFFDNVSEFKSMENGYVWRQGLQSIS